MKRIKKIAVINGPNINILGKREPDIYGVVTLKKIEDDLRMLGSSLGVDMVFYQSNHEGNIVDFIQENMDEIDGVVINPAAFTKAGYSILDALTAIDLPYVEIHISNIFARGGWHADSIFSAHAVGMISGMRDYGYSLGVLAIYNYLTNNVKEGE